MNIRIEAKKRKTFNELDEGDFFTIKTNKTNDIFIKIKTFVKDEKVYNCVNVNSGKFGLIDRTIGVAKYELFLDIAVNLSKYVPTVYVCEIPNGHIVMTDSSYCMVVRNGVGSCGALVNLCGGEVISNPLAGIRAVVDITDHITNFTAKEID
jgi:hypothetical protein